MPAAAAAVARISGGYAQSRVPLDAMMAARREPGSLLNALATSSRTMRRTSSSVSWVCSVVGRSTVIGRPLRSWLFKTLMLLDARTAGCGLSVVAVVVAHGG